MKKKIKISVVGIGLMGSQHLKAISISKKAKLHSIVDINQKSKLVAKKFKVPFYKTSHDLIKNNKPDATILNIINGINQRDISGFHNTLKYFSDIRVIYI